jgi:ABC-type dipeptide/oligopeptide/nickel transport system permease subunit
MATTLIADDTTPAANPFMERDAAEIEGLWKAAFRRLRKNKLALISVWYIGFMILLAIIGPFLVPYHYSKQDYELVTQGPSWAHPMGTDQLGRDMLARLIFGARVSITVGIVVQLVILIIGVPLGAIAGYFGGWSRSSCVSSMCCMPCRTCSS